MKVLQEGHWLVFYHDFSDEEELNHLINEFFGVDSLIYQYCIHNKIKLHRKLKAKFKSCEELNYIDPETGASAKLSEDDIYEINAIPSFKAYMQNGLGPRLQFSLDTMKYSREDFLRYLGGTYD